ncbi:unnamed protein product, partial [marine sediment metagenome]
GLNSPLMFSKKQQPDFEAIKKFVESKIYGLD